jgi:hypothetical protein
MSKHKQRKSPVTVAFDPGLKSSSANGEKVKYSGNKIQELDFSKTSGAVADLDDMESRQSLAIMLSAIKRAKLPWCPECNIHKAVEDDNLCGICSKIAAEHGPRGILELHNKYCSSCQRPLCETCKEKKARHGGKLCEGCERDRDDE